MCILWYRYNSVPTEAMDKGRKWVWWNFVDFNLCGDHQHSSWNFLRLKVLNVNIFVLIGVLNINLYRELHVFV